MPKYAVRYYKIETSSVRCEMTVEAENEDAAYAYVQAGHEGGLEFTRAELDTEWRGNSFGGSLEFSEMQDRDEPFAVCEVV